LLGEGKKILAVQPELTHDTIIEITVQPSGELCYGEKCEMRTVVLKRNSKVVWKCKDENNKALTFSIRFRTKSPVQVNNPNESPHPQGPRITSAIPSVKGKKTLWISPAAEEGTYKYSVAVLKGGIIFMDDPEIIVPRPR
ncbi:MAG: hypothetical protein KAT17_01635, partial [Candidatus Aminicenantes bacterium]|nr:hypothetical protein [Candidatus Aminicenantes bacterium]